MDQSVLMPVAMRIVKDLGPFLLVTTEDTLSLVLETLSSIMNVGKATWITPELAEQLSTAMLEVWVKNVRGEYLLFHTRVLRTDSKYSRRSHPHFTSF